MSSHAAVPRALSPAAIAVAAKTRGRLSPHSSSTVRNLLTAQGLVLSSTSVSEMD